MDNEFFIDAKDTDGTIILANKDNISLYVKDGVLKKILAPFDNKDLTIPYKTSVNVEITSIALDTCFGAMRKITISDGITNVAEHSFESAKIREVVWPSTCRVIPAYCFAFSKLQKISGIENVEVLEQSAFYQSELCEIKGTFSSLKAAHAWALSSTFITRISLPGFCRLGNRVFEECGSLKSVEFQPGFESIPPFCFSRCRQLDRITMPDSVSFIGDNAFEGTDFFHFHWPAACEEIPQKCFYNSGLKSIDGIENVSRIGSRAFAGCTELKKFDWPEKCKSVENGTFMYCSSLSRINGVNMVSRIENKAFARTGFNPDYPLDLSHSIVCEIEKGAFHEMKPNCVVHPYYVPDKKISAAFKN